jgi:hypothetical protein
MRLGVCLSVCCALALGASPARADKPKVELSDPKLPLWEFRAMDRRVVVITLEGAWKSKPIEGASYEIALRFPDGATYSHKPINDELFRLGEVRVLVQEYLLIRHRLTKGGKIQVFVTERRTVVSPVEVVSNRFEVAWPLKREVVREAPRTKFSPDAEDIPPPPDK